MLDTKPAATQPNFPDTATVFNNPALENPPSVARISSQELMPNTRELEIDHHGKIYRLRITQLNKLILTA